MEVRRIKPEERVRAGLVGTIVFLGTASSDYKEQLKNPLEHSRDYENLWASFDDKGKMVSYLHVHDFNVNFDGHTVGMGGIGGVSTLPEARKGGYCRGIFEKILPAMKYEQNMVFSFLFPFSFGFYRKFGYEQAYSPSRLTIPMNYFRDYPVPDGIAMFEHDEDTTPYFEVYNEFIKDKNMAVVRDAKAMHFRVNNDPYTSKRYAYLHRNSSGKADAYILCRSGERGDSGNTLRAQEIAWTTPESLHALFGFIGGLSPQFGSLSWDAPSQLNALTLFAEGYEIRQGVPANGMNRVLNVQKAFELMKAPLHAGRAVIGVHDKSLPCNTGIYTLEWENGAVTSVRKGSGAADLETDVETLAQLVPGYISIDQARWKREVKIKGNEAGLQALFPIKNQFMSERF